MLVLEFRPDAVCQVLHRSSLKRLHAGSKRCILRHLCAQKQPVTRRPCVQLKSVEGFEPGQQLKADELFKVGDFVDVAGTSVGKGFQGAARLRPARVVVGLGRSGWYTCGEWRRRAPAEALTDREHSSPSPQVPGQGRVPAGAATQRVCRVC